MIKGINRQIIEVTDTGNVYYERAILFIRPEYRFSHQHILDKQAKQMLSEFKAPSAIRKKNMLLSQGIKLAASAIFGATVAFIFMNMM